jgi:hypothetical protein
VSLTLHDAFLGNERGIAQAVSHVRIVGFGGEEDR